MINIELDSVERSFLEYCIVTTYIRGDWIDSTMKDTMKEQFKVLSEKLGIDIIDRTRFVRHDEEV